MIDRDPDVRYRQLAQGAGISKNLLIKKLARETGADTYPLQRVRRPELARRLVEAEIEAGLLDAKDGWGEDGIDATH